MKKGLFIMALLLVAGGAFAQGDIQAAAASSMADKTSLIVSSKNKPGALSRLLTLTRLLTVTGLLALLRFSLPRLLAMTLTFLRRRLT